MILFNQLQRKSIVNTFKIVGSMLMLLFLFSKVDTQKVIQSAQNADLPTLVFAMSITPLSMYFRWVKWDTLVRSESDISKKNTFYMYLVGLFFSSITPAKMGDLVRVKYLQKKGVSFSTGFLISIFDRFFDLIAICLYAFFVTIFFKNVFFISIISIVLLCIILFFFQHDMLLKVLLLYSEVLPKKITTSKYIQFFITQKFKKLTDRILPKHIRLFFVLLSLATWLSLGIQTQLLLGSFSIHVSVLKIITVICAGAISGLIPLSFSGYGFREGMIAFLLSQLGVEYEIGITVAFLYTFFSFLLPAVLSGIIFLLVEHRQQGEHVF